MNKFILTIVCTTYNHERYIRKTLDGFINQKTTYKYKIIVHDDASTDNTKKFIEEYAKKYPNLIYPIYQKENQYSQGIKIYKTFIEPLINTKYIASCEGDDYWNDDNKLELQLNYLENHNECSMCVHNTVKISETGKTLNQYASDVNIKSRNIGIKEIIETCGHAPFHTSSYVYRSEKRKNMPEVFSALPIGDYPTAIYMATQGTVHYIAKVMSAYRFLAKGSWTEQNLKNLEIGYQISCKMIEGLKNIDKFTDYKYTKSFQKVITWHEFNNILYKKEYRKLLKLKYIILLIKRLCPSILKKILKKLIN